ncbi:(Fe-S)-binding protein [Mammaliicoccus vitulinus]|uniref:(Fe-S)-binding protein n=1 Tax=Mammaliicoccus vitulinus TaxID=71237 RepID=UPI000D1D2ECA|nr:(Fe-S)-binding protein [Mammaliicoccus vitulinus]PTI89288.1 glycolate oxidase [Mammaliicoccus vitulinus]QQT14551.1 (Fe-S)-binding protein [Mammaliicoccus vitulinus]QQY20150.1 (Fe-S)-binding protein [Mammaliicoccus vitulinus]RTX84033.1 (Fe-S)-binding protein [Mammaliicoccus vitulinus]GGI00853.1 putative glycolate oxidase iron-sulfur subunit [Mammaliicoccus vitulinus]
MTSNLIDKLDYDATFDCVQCGFCLPSCPTYLTMKEEKHSPRGRINLVKYAVEGKVTLKDLEEAIDLCLGCRQCEKVCPTDVKYGDIYESAVEVLREKRNKKLDTRIMSLFLERNYMLDIMYQGLKLYHTPLISTVINKTKALDVLPERLGNMAAILPPVKKEKTQTQNPFRTKKITVGFFRGCMMDAFFSNINDLAIKILQAHDIQVVEIKQQTCCGALQHHAGEMEKSKKLAKLNIEALEKYDVDYYVNAIGGCGASLIEYDHLLRDDESWKARAEKFVGKVRDISVILDNINLNLDIPINIKATYQPSCHLQNVQHVFNEPEKIIQRIKGLDYKVLPEKDICCGSAGIYNIVNYDASMDILDRKMSHVKEVEPQLIITSNPGCHLQMLLGVKKEGLEEKIKVKHIVEVVAEACGIR